ncbi:MAG: orotate phosphoribosyltransferase [Nitrososphaerales archaeon]
MAKKEKELFNEKLAKTLLKIRAIKVGTFESHEGKMTPYFIDLRGLPSFPNAFSLAIECFEFALREIERDSPFDCFCGVSINGLMLASTLAYKSRKPLVFPASARAPEKGLRGYLNPGARVIVIDDVSETGISMKSAVLTLRAAGGVVDSALTLIDRLESSARTMNSVGVRLHSFTTIKELGMALKEKMAMTEEEESAMESVL